MLDELYRLWPDCPAQRIVGDSNFDVAHVNAMCERAYGLHPIFRLGGVKTRKMIGEKWTRGGTIDAITHEGRLVCARHGKEMNFAGMEVPARTRPLTKAELAAREEDDESTHGPLEPGKETRDTDFRVRAHCADGCGKPGMKAAFDWRRLTYYPHYPQGRPDLYAQREAYLDRMSGHESFWNRIKTAHKLANSGPARTRLLDMNTVHCTIELAATAVVALTLVDQRQQRGIGLDNAVMPSRGPRAQAKGGGKAKTHRRPAANPITEKAAA